MVEKGSRVVTCGPACGSGGAGTRAAAGPAAAAGSARRLASSLQSTSTGSLPDYGTQLVDPYRLLEDDLNGIYEDIRSSPFIGKCVSVKWCGAPGLCNSHFSHNKLQRVRVSTRAPCLVELKPRDVERPVELCMSEMLHARHKRKVFNIESSLVIKSGYIMIIQKEENHGDNRAMRRHPQQNRIFIKKKLMLCIWWDRLGVVYYKLLNPSETITGTQLMRLSRGLKEKCFQYYSRHDKIILLHDNAHPHVAVPGKNYLKTLDWEVLPHPPYSSDIAPSDYHLFRSMVHALSEQRFTSHHMKKSKIVLIRG
ncbi:Mariner Mos1 transposase [Eumeta japonica]|uniref:Mariner Mos1 transposase n=1 Tax=Eumeta variegata TaxID=151549 RepID=A0A4C1Z279_EUMVA|nr:Mariner Mos1 transposase [Eumeta japonica]